MLLAMARDIRVILVKLADRLDNMRTLEHMPPEKQERIARETLEIYAPLANRLGIQWIKVELEDLAFKYLVARGVRAARATRSRRRTQGARASTSTTSCRRSAERAGRAAASPCEVYGPRQAPVVDLPEDEDARSATFEQIYDVDRVPRDRRQSMATATQALGVVHSTWTPIPGRFKDYIALPKPNMYQSLHTDGDRPERRAHRGPDPHARDAPRRRARHRRALEVQGGQRRRRRPEDDEKFALAAPADGVPEGAQGPDGVPRDVKIDLFGDEVYVFTPKGDVRALPTGATPIDFAYAIHSEVGDHCSGARVNGMIVPLRYQLRNGDTVEIITEPEPEAEQGLAQASSSPRARARKIRALPAHRAARQVARARARAARAGAAQARH